MPGSCWAVIPARYASTRFPGKPLARIAGLPMIQHVWQRCIDAAIFEQVIVATDDMRIADACREFKANVVMTSPDCPSGTDRLAEVAKQMPLIDWWVNVQGDEPLISPEALRALVHEMMGKRTEMATLVRTLDDDEISNPNVVKAVRALSGDALYFSRAALPFQRDLGSSVTRYGHIGIYGYSRDALLRLAALPPSPLEQAEKLEQLRALENGIRIRCVVTDYRSIGVDTPEDIARAEAAFEAAAT